MDLEETLDIMGTLNTLDTMDTLDTLDTMDFLNSLDPVDTPDTLDIQDLAQTVGKTTQNNLHNLPLYMVQTYSHVHGTNQSTLPYSCISACYTMNNNYETLF